MDVPISRVSLGYQQLTSMASATKLTVPAGADFAYIVAEAQSVRWRDDGTAPTATVGQLLPAGVPLQLSGASVLAAAQFIQATSGAILNVSYYQAPNA
jgi:hypothetical protein